jgi:hypothetical protein
LSSLSGGWLCPLQEIYLKDAAILLHVVGLCGTCVMIKAAEKDLDSNQLPIGGDELMSLNHIAIKVTDEPEEGLHAPLLVSCPPGI